MTDPVEELLAQIQAQSSGDAPTPSSPSSASSSPPSASPTAAQPSLAIDHLLADIDGKPVPPPEPETFVSPPPVPRFNRQAIEARVEPARSSSDSEMHDPLLAEVKAQYDELDRTAALRQQQLVEEKRRQQEECRQQHRATLIQRADAWLKHLDPRSGEALWFEEFATKYPSRQEAAIDYLGLEQDAPGSPS